MKIKDGQVRIFEADSGLLFGYLIGCEELCATGRTPEEIVEKISDQITTYNDIEQQMVFEEILKQLNLNIDSYVEN